MPNLTESLMGGGQRRRRDDRAKMDVDAQRLAESDMSKMQDRINQFLSAVQNRENQASARRLDGVPAAKFSVTYGARYATVHRQSGSQTLPFCRIHLGSGDLVDTKLTPDSSDDALVGNIFSFDFGLQRLTLYGVPPVQLRARYINTAPKEEPETDAETDAPADEPTDSPVSEPVEPSATAPATEPSAPAPTEAVDPNVVSTASIDKDRDPFV